MDRKRGSEHLSGVRAAELSRLSENSRGSFVVKAETGSKKEKLDFKKSEHEGKRPKCSSKNAVMARMNRLKKKCLMESLQSDVARLSDENTKLKQTLEGQSSLVCSLRKEVHYLKGVLANNREISMLLRSIQNTGLPVTSSLSKYTMSNQIYSPLDHNYVCTRSDSSISSSSSDLVDGSNTTLTVDGKEQIPIINDVALSLSVPHDNNLDLPLVSPSDGNLYDTEFSGCYSVQPATLDSPPVVGTAAGDEPFMDVGVCLHVAKRRVSLEFCSTCNSNALSTWNDLDTVK
jgi:hypothetical protein